MCKMIYSVLFLVSFVSSPVFTSLTKFGPSCSFSDLRQYKCKNSSICIGVDQICDGVKDCADGSDEIFCLRSKGGNHLHKNDRETFCGKNQKRCSDGSCIPHHEHCNEISSHHIGDGGYTHVLGQPFTTRDRRHAKPLISPYQCVLPSYPEHGTYVVSNMPDARPGDRFDSFLLTVSCRRGFGFMEQQGGIDNHGTQQIYCINGRWIQTMPKCVRFCKLNPHPSVRYTCHVPGDDFRTCKKYLPPGTAVNPICKGPIYTSARVQPYMKCISGYWDYIAECQAECGQVTSEGVQLVIGGELAKRGELPWHVGIYRKTTDPYMQICGGSLVSNNVVISAAHCFWDDARKQLPASDFAVAIGKLYRPWNNPHDVDVQRSDVKEIKIPVLFYGTSTNLQEDIATMILKTPFVYKTHVRPVCLHFDLNFERRQLQQGKYGKVAGWGLTAANGQPSPILKVVQLPYISLEVCLNAVPKQFREYLTIDKFCAGYTNGTALCRGDSGGGLSFAAYTELDVERYYLRGVVSAAPITEDLCNAHTYTTFTKISKHEEFIKDTLDRAEKTCPPYMFQCDNRDCAYQGADCNGKRDCADGSDETDALCKPGYVDTIDRSQATCVLPDTPEHGTYTASHAANAQPGESLESFELTVSCDTGYDMVDSKGIEKKSPQKIRCSNGQWEQEMPKCAISCGRIEADSQGKRRELPWHVNIYMKMPNYLHTCGGTLVSNKVVLSAATCFDENNVPQKTVSPNKYAVAAGKLRGRWDDTSDTSIQKSDVKEIKISTLSKSAKSKIAAIVLATPFRFTSSVRPACVNLDPTFDAEHLQQGKLGKTATWPFEAVQQAPYKLRMMEPVELSNNKETCNSFLQGAQGENICAAYTKDPRVFAVFAGSGLVYPHSSLGLDHYYLRGIMSNLLVCGNGCVDSDFNYHAYTKLSDYKDFIQKNLN